MGERVENTARVKDEGNGNLLIKNVQQDDEGEYMCIASNVGGNATHVTTLDVQGKSEEEEYTEKPVMRDCPKCSKKWS